MPTVKLWGKVEPRWLLSIEMTIKGQQKRPAACEYDASFSELSTNNWGFLGTIGDDNHAIMSPRG